MVLEWWFHIIFGILMTCPVATPTATRPPRLRHALTITSMKKKTAGFERESVLERNPTTTPTNLLSTKVNHLWNKLFTKKLLFLTSCPWLSFAPAALSLKKHRKQKPRHFLVSEKMQDQNENRPPATFVEAWMATCGTKDLGVRMVGGWIKQTTPAQPRNKHHWTNRLFQGLKAWHNWEAY